MPSWSPWTGDSYVAPELARGARLGLGRDPAEVVTTALYLAAPASIYTTGSLIRRGWRPALTDCQFAGPHTVVGRLACLPGQPNWFALLLVRRVVIGSAEGNA